jgi:hypothetical protein
MGCDSVAAYLKKVDPSDIIRNKVKSVGITADHKNTLITKIQKLWGNPEDNPGGLLANVIDPPSYALNWLQQLWPIIRHFPNREIGEPILIGQVEARLLAGDRSRVPYLVTLDLMEIKKKHNIISARASNRLLASKRFLINTNI